MRARSIRFRLTSWYSGVLALALTTFGIFFWIAIQGILFRTVDEELVDRAEGIRMFMENQIEALSIEEIRDEFKEHSVLGPGGDLFQVCDANGVWLYRSIPLEEADIAIDLPGSLLASGKIEDREISGTNLRFYSKPVTVLGERYTIQVAAPTHEIIEGLQAFQQLLALMIPAFLLAAAAGGWWMSGRALRPVDQITAAARSISERSLAKRLPVPATNDELRRLSDTLNQMLSRIEEAFQRVTQFTADASHELRTPVALIRTTAEVALRKDRSKDEYRRALADVLEESVRTAELIEHLLTLARADAGKAVLERTPLDLALLAQDVVAQCQRLAQGKGLHLTLNVPASGAMIAGEAQALRRVLLLLLDNAVKFTPAGGRIEVMVNQSVTTVQMAIRDSGIGISPDDLPHIFKRFYRSEKSRNREYGGAGLGLSLAMWIVEAHNGTIQVESEPGRGSVFQVSLPRAGA